MTGPIQTEWIHYSAVLPPDAGPIQIEETRRAFFAGAYTLFHRILGQLQPGEDATNADLNLLDVMHEELERWRILESGRAEPRSKKGTPAEGS